MPRAKAKTKISSTETSGSTLDFVKSDLLERFVPILLVASVGLAFVVGMLWQKVSYLESGGTRAAGAGVAGDSAQVPTELLPSSGKLTDDQISKIPTVSDSEHIRGNKDAKVTIIEYSDLECPFCKQFHPTLLQAIQEFPNDVRWVYRHYPIDTRHPKADKEAEAIECAKDQAGEDGFWRLTDKIYEVTPANNGLDLTTLPTLANQVGLNGNQLQACLDSGKYAEYVEKDYQGGVAAGVGGTPGVFVMNNNGAVWTLPGAVDYSTLKASIEEALKS